MRLTTKFKKEGKFYIASCPELGVTTQGKNLKEAKKNLKEAVELHIETIIDYMIEHGNVRFENGKIISRM